MTCDGRRAALGCHQLALDLLHVQAHQDVHLIGLPVLELVDFVLDLELRAPGLAGGMLLIVDGDGDGVAGVPGVAIERAAERVPIGFVVVIGIGGRMRAEHVQH